MNTFDDKIAMTLVEKGEISVEDIKLKEQEEGYQRAIEKGRLDRLRTSYEKHGYLEDKRIVLNPNNEPVEGQHRVRVLRENGIKKVDFIRYSYDTPEDEWRHFCLLNNWNPTLAKKDEWHARLGSGDRAAEILYQLNSDEGSILYGKIGLRGFDGYWKFRIPQVLLLVNYSLGIHDIWSRTRERISYDKLIYFSYNDIRQTINSILGWFNNCFGLPSESSPRPYKATIFRPLLKFYHQLDIQHKLETEKSKTGTINKMKQFDFSDPTFVKADEFTKLVNLVSFYNHAKRKKDVLILKY